jgi:hypothetical protein
VTNATQDPREWNILVLGWFITEHYSKLDQQCNAAPENDHGPVVVHRVEFVSMGGLFGSTGPTRASRPRSTRSLCRKLDVSSPGASKGTREGATLSG